MAAPAHRAVGTAPPRIQRFAGQPTGHGNTAPNSVDSVLASRGRPLDPAIQQDMGQRFGYDFSRVRIHADGFAAESARDVGAHAYSVGDDVVFGAREFAPHTTAGRHLLTHELAHVMQQHDAGASRVLRRRPTQRRSEREIRAANNRRDSRKTRRSSGNGLHRRRAGADRDHVQEKSELNEGEDSISRADKPETPHYTEYKTATGGAVTWFRPPGTVIANRVILKIAAADFDMATFARQQFDAVPEEIKARLTSDRGKKLETPEEMLGFAYFAESLIRRGITAEELMGFKKEREVYTWRTIDWATEWQDAVDEVIGARAQLERKSEENIQALQRVAQWVPNVPEKVYELYRLSKVNYPACAMKPSSA